MLRLGDIIDADNNPNFRAEVIELVPDDSRSRRPLDWIAHVRYNDGSIGPLERDAEWTPVTIPTIDLPLEVC